MPRMEAVELSHATVRIGFVLVETTELSLEILCDWVLAFRNRSSSSL